ncbi:D-glycerate dehydrogenase [Candidatus Uhrbacteria bacterium]|nr:D-glycerate dehydrogenase [Candidatus Uhrbacteria bacterium]
MCMPKVFVTHPIPDRGVELLREKGYEVTVNPSSHKLPAREELIPLLQNREYAAVLLLLNDKVDAEVFDAAGKQCKIFANYAVGYDNIDLAAAAERRIMVTNTPDVLNETVAEHTFALMLAIAHRVVEADRFMRAGKFHGWEPMMLLGTDVSHKTLGVIGLGRIGSLVVAHGVRGFGMRALYYDVKRNETFEREYRAEYRGTVEDVLKEADFVSLHVPLLDSTWHLINATRLTMMKRSAYLVNTSRGPVIDEAALADALKHGVIRGAALDVFENEPEMHPGLKDLDNVIVTPHIASATEETRQKMSEVAARNIIAALEGQAPPNLVTLKI